MARGKLNFLQLLDLAIGTPEVGCLNLNMLFLCLKRLILHNSLEHEFLDIEDHELLGMMDVPGSNKDEKNRTNNLWSLMKLKNTVETNQEGINRLFELISDMVNGETNVVTWGALDEHLHRGEEKTHVELEKTLQDLEDAKTYFGGDDEKKAEIEEKREEILERKARFTTQPDRKSTRDARKSTFSFRSYMSDKHMSDLDGTRSDSEYASYLSEPVSVQTPSVVVEDESDAEALAGKTPHAGNRQQQSKTRRKKKRTKKRSTGEIEVTRSLSEEEDQDPEQQRQQPLSSTPSPQRNQLRSSRGGGGRLKKPLETDSAATDQDLPSEPSHHVGFGAGGDQDAATHVTVSSRPQSAFFSIMGDDESLLRPDEGASAAMKTLSNIGAMSLTKGAMEERLKVLENQVQTVMRFRNAMIQGDYLPQLVKMLGEGGVDVLKNLIETEKKPGEGISSIKADVMELGMVVEELTGRVDDFEDALDVIRNHQKYMKEMIHEHHSQASEQFEDIQKQLKTVREKCQHLEITKADRFWVLAELATKMDSVASDNFVTQEELKTNLDEIAMSLNEFMDRSAEVKDFLHFYVQDTKENMEGKLGLDVFVPFRDGYYETVARLEGYMKEILEITDGEQDGAFVKILKYHCASCDRPTRCVRRGPTPALPAIDALSNTNKSTQPYIAYGQSEIRKHMRDNHNNTPTINVTNVGTHQYDTNNNEIKNKNTNDNKSSEANRQTATLTGKKTSSMKTSKTTTTTRKKELMTPVRIQNVRGFDATLAERRKKEEEKAEKNERDQIGAATKGRHFGNVGNSSGGVEGETGVRMIKMEPSVDERVDRKQVRENAVDAYYRRLAAADVEDVWKQKRPVGGENTLIKPRQRIAREKMSTVVRFASNDSIETEKISAVGSDLENGKTGREANDHSEDVIFRSP